MNEITCWIPLGRFVYCIGISDSGAKLISIGFALACQALGFDVPYFLVSCLPAAASASHSDAWQRLRLPAPQ